MYEITNLVIAWILCNFVLELYILTPNVCVLLKKKLQLFSFLNGLSRSKGNTNDL